MRNIRFIKKSIQQFIFPRTNDQIIQELDRVNLHYLRVIATVFVVFELARLFYLPTYTLTARVADKYFRTIFIIVVSILVAIISTLLRKKENRKHYQAVLLLVCTFFCWSTWAFFTSYSHYVIGEQIITFFTTLFVFVCFINMSFRISFPLISCEFVLCFIMLYNTNEAGKINLYNFFVMYLVLVLAAILKYHYSVSQTKSSLRIMKMNEALNKVSRYDYITQSRNRYALNNDLYKYIGRKLFIVVCDIDYLKFYNDKYGHLMGDKIISSVAKSAKETFTNAHVYRYGGDEFIILGDAKDSESVENMLNTLKNKISNTHIKGIKESLYCSFGYVISDIESEENIEHNIAEADKLLYKNKQINHKKYSPSLSVD